jgi:hypothetical protein
MFLVRLDGYAGTRAREAALGMVTIIFALTPSRAFSWLMFDMSQFCIKERFGVHFQLERLALKPVKGAMPHPFRPLDRDPIRGIAVQTPKNFTRFAPQTHPSVFTLASISQLRAMPAEKEAIGSIQFPNAAATVVAILSWAEKVQPLATEGTGQPSEANNLDDIFPILSGRADAIFKADALLFSLNMD